MTARFFFACASVLDKNFLFPGHYWHERMHWAVAANSLSLGKQSQAQSYIHHVILTAVP